MRSLQDQRYAKLVERLRDIRNAKGLTQEQVASLLGVTQSFVAKVEGLERRLDVLELIDWLSALKTTLEEFFSEPVREAVGNGNAILTPIKGDIESHPNGVLQKYAYRGKVLTLLLEGITRDQYLTVEREVSGIFSALNAERPSLKNREAIVNAFEFAISAMPDLNPSDVYQQIIYRFYLREYKKSKPDQSWVRAGGEAMELFVERHYTPILLPKGVHIKALISGAEKAKALQEMGLKGKVGDSKLDVVLYGEDQGRLKLFGGIHCKASLAERVSDDVPCSVAMMRGGYYSVLYTFDSKSFPPPQGDLVNRGELGSHTQPSDKRKYIEEHGSFDACFSYNLRSNPSVLPTRSGKQIYVCSLRPQDDLFPSHVLAAWFRFRSGSKVR
jgi:transcriptional regulator with XRE-family HTH domain